MGIQDIKTYIAFVQTQSTIIKVIFSIIILVCSVGAEIIIWSGHVVNNEDKKDTANLQEDQSKTRTVVKSTQQSGGQTGYNIYNYNSGNNIPGSSKSSNITFERISIFYVEVSVRTYQIGVVVRLFNKDTFARQVSKIELVSPILFQVGGSGNAILRKVFITGRGSDNNGDMAIKPSDYKEYKFLLPIKWELKLIETLPPEIVFINDFSVKFEDGVESLNHAKPYFYGNFDRVISNAEWIYMLSPSSKIDISNILFKRTSSSFDVKASAISYILFNPDQSAKISAYGFDNTNYITNDSGALVMLVGPGEPVIDNGWILLGRSYEEIEHDAAKKHVYDSICPPDPAGNMNRLDAGFRAADRLTVGPITDQMLPVKWDFVKGR